MPDPRVAARAELVRARRNAAARPTATPQTGRRLDARLAVPLAVAVVVVAVGAVAGRNLPLLAVIGLAAVAVVVVDFAVARRDFAARDRKEAIFAAVVAVILAVGAATGISGWLVLVTLAVVAVATARVAAHPATRERKDRARREAARAAELDTYAKDWPRVAAAAGCGHMALNGPVVDRAPAGRTYRLLVGPEHVIGDLLGLAPRLTSAFDYLYGCEWGDVTVEVHPKRPREGFVHVREGNPIDALDPLDTAEPVASIYDPVMVGVYADGQPYHLHFFVRDSGGVDKLVVGDKGMGKSSLEVAAFRKLRRTPDCALVVADGATGRDFGPWAKGGAFFRYYQTPADVLNMLRTLEFVLEGRERLMDERGWRVWQPSALHPVLVVLIEELAKYGEDKNCGQVIRAIITRMSKRNRAPGIVFLGSTQTGTGGAVGGHDFRRMMPDRIQFYSVERSEVILRPPPPWETETGDLEGMFFASTRGEKRGLRVSALWVSDEERREVISDMATHLARPEDEWLEAEHARLLAEKPVQDSAAAPERPSLVTVGGETVEGEYTVRSVAMRPVREPAPKPPELEWDQARRVFNDLLEGAGRVGVTMRDLEAATGRKRTWVREQLLVPAVDGGEVKLDRRGRDHRYVLAEHAPAA